MGETMIKLRQQVWLLALLAILALFAGCKSESASTPTSPTPPPTTGGGTPPPTGASVTLTVSNANPTVSSVSTITATVTQNGSPVPNGTAVEFDTTFGTFTDTNEVKTIRTTTNGVASAVLTSAAPGKATVTAVVNNVSKSTLIQFVVPASPTPTPNTDPTITKMTPTTGKPQGGDVITITGTNFRTPVRVLFDDGAGHVKDAFVSSVTPTTVTAVTPAFSIGTGNKLVATVTVLFGAGNPDEKSVKAPDFTYQADVLTPSITTVSPTSGPAAGGTNVTIIGDGFQAPVQVFFGAAEAQVMSISFNQIKVITPKSGDTTAGGSGAFTGPVDIRVLNIASNKSATLSAGFRYTPKILITSMGPTQGNFGVTTQVLIDGEGFEDPVAVVVGGFAAQPIKVTGTEILANAGPIAITSCSDVNGATTVTNIGSGDTAQGPSFTYKVPKPVIVGVNPSTVTLGVNSTFDVTVANPGAGIAKFKVGNTTVFPTASVTLGNGDVRFTIPLPSNFTFPTVSCTVGGVTGTTLGPLSQDVTFTNATTTCTDVATNALTVNPPACGCATPPSATVTNPAGGGCANAGTTTVGTTSTATITIMNSATAASSLTITAPTVTGTNPGDFTVTPASRTIAPGSSGSFTVNFTPSAAGPRSANVSFTTNDAANNPLVVCLTGTGS